MPRIALTMGDPAGVGPELVLRALHNVKLRDQCELVIFGDRSVLESSAAVLDLSVADYRTIPAGEFSKCAASLSGHTLVDFGNLPAATLTRGQVSAACGRASFEYIQAAIDAALANQVDGITTGPINKSALHAAGLNYPGHTEMFAERAADDAWCMMQYSPEITCTFVTVHVGYAEVPRLLSRESVLATIRLTRQAMWRIRRREPQLVVCGLNPHAGESGLFGTGEEEKLIRPAIEAARAEGMSIEGPLPPDTAFLPSKREQTDAFVCMYHDQGHIPVKALAFDSAVNTSLGLKIIRTSVDHGTAYDIAWKGIARPNSLYAAIKLACRLAARS